MFNNKRTTFDTHEPKSDAEWSPKMIDDTLSPAVREFVRLRKSGWEATLAPLLIGVLLMTAGCSHEEPGGAEAAEGDKIVNVAVSKVVRADLSQGLRIAAEFRPFQEINVYAKVPGYVKQIYVDVGDRVKKGQTLAVLEVPELQDELNQAAASGRQSEQEVEQARHELKRAEADHTVAHLTYQRLEGVMKTRPGLLAQQDVDDAQGKDQAAEAQVEAAKAGLAAAQEHLYAATANRERVQALFDYTRITAPFDGVVTARYADTGAMLAAGTSSEQQALPLVKLSQNALLRLDIPVPETDVPSVRLGKKVSVEVQALNKTFEGTVARFADKVDSATRTMMTEVDVPNPNLEIVPGYVRLCVLPSHGEEERAGGPHPGGFAPREQGHRVSQSTATTGLKCGRLPSASKPAARLRSSRGFRRATGWWSATPANCGRVKSSLQKSWSCQRSREAANVPFRHSQSLFHHRSLSLRGGDRPHQPGPHAGGLVSGHQYSGSGGGNVLQRHASGGNGRQTSPDVSSASSRWERASTTWSPGLSKGSASSRFTFSREPTPMPMPPKSRTWPWLTWDACPRVRCRRW